MTADPFLWRFEKFAELGFSPQEATALANSRDSKGVPVYWAKVKQALDAGASHATALELFISEGVGV